MLDKYVYVNLDGYKASVRQASGVLQLNDATVTGKCPKQTAARLDKLLEETFKVISKYNKEISECKKEKTPTPKKEKKPEVKGLE